MMTGAVPNTGWLERCIVLDDKGFIKTGPDLSQDDLAAARWPLTRPPYLLETSRPGVFAVGRCARRQYQARRVRRRRRINCGRVCSPSASVVSVKGAEIRIRAWSPGLPKSLLKHPSASISRRHEKWGRPARAVALAAVLR